jgi:hypothetical protein
MLIHHHSTDVSDSSTSANCADSKQAGEEAEKTRKVLRLWLVQLELELGRE